VPAKKKKKCCRSKPRCKRCPVRARLEADLHERSAPLGIVGEILGGSHSTVPACVTDALLGLSVARGAYLAEVRAATSAARDFAGSPANTPS
jgi:adenine-specific DNA glycosylase